MNTEAAESRWPAALAIQSIGGLHYALPSELTVGPDWLCSIKLPCDVFLASCD